MYVLNLFIKDTEHSVHNIFYCFLHLIRVDVGPATIAVKPRALSRYLPRNEIGERFRIIYLYTLVFSPLKDYLVESLRHSSGLPTSFECPERPPAVQRSCIICHLNSQTSRGPPRCDLSGCNMIVDDALFQFFQLMRLDFSVKMVISMLYLLHTY